MRAELLFSLLVCACTASFAAAAPRSSVPPAPALAPLPPPPTVPREVGLASFAGVLSVLQSPRCQNCHPAGVAPLQTDAGVPHSMGITRDSPQVGLDCAACHREVGLDLPNLPPASPHWHLPPAVQVFEGRSPAALCAQLLDPAQTGGRDLGALREHVKHDPLVLYAWSPGGGRTVPPLSHEAFVESFGAWVDAGAPCPAR